MAKDTEEEFENITNASQLLAAPDLRWEWVPLRGVKTTSGKTPRVRAYELTLREYNECIDGLRVRNKDGVQVDTNTRDQDVNLLAWTIRDHNRNRLWQTAEEANAQIGSWGKALTDQLIYAVNRVNASVSDEVVEGNSEGGPSDTPPSDSPGTSKSGTSTDS